jgi:hypothetical protein
MKNGLIGVVIGFCILSLFSYTDTKGVERNDYNVKGIVILPLKQKRIAVVDNLDRANTLVQKGWVLQDVDLVFSRGGHLYGRQYTLILY